jgi:hypothetical protein
MKAVTVMFALFVFATVCSADPFKPALIDDLDGFTNIRASMNADSLMVGKVKTGELFYTIPSGDNWWRVIAIEGKTGFMSKSHIRLIEESTSDPQSKSITPAGMEATEDPTDAEAQYTLGLKYYYGFGIPTDTKNSAVWFRKAAEQGHIAAKASLGQQLFLGEGVQKDRQFGMALIKEGVEAGSAHAQRIFAFCLATLYDTNEGFSAANQRLTLGCIFWFKKAAAQGGIDGARAACAARRIEAAYRADLRDEAAVQLWNALVGGGSQGSGEETYGGYTDRQIDAMDQHRRELEAQEKAERGF